MSTNYWRSVMLNLFQHPYSNETLKQVQGDWIQTV